jgi:hypothetical protein
MPTRRGFSLSQLINRANQEPQQLLVLIVNRVSYTRVRLYDVPEFGGRQVTIGFQVEVRNCPKLAYDLLENLTTDFGLTNPEIGKESRYTQQCRQSSQKTIVKT